MKKQVLSKEEFIKLSEEKFGKYLDYSLLPSTFYALDIIKLICPNHGIFEIVARNHLDNQNPCSQCYFDKNIYTFDKFVKKANKIFNFKYKYENFKKMSKKVTVICPEHGSFEIMPHSHLGGTGCQICRKIFNIRKYTTDKIIDLDKGIVFCEIHGEYNIKKYHKCLKCEKENKIKEKIDIKVNLLKSKFPEYDFFYKNYRYYTICKNHPEANKKPRTFNSIIKRPCIFCNPINKKYDTEKFIEKSKSLFSNLCYDKTIYTGSHENVTLYCLIHKQYFDIKAYSHIGGHSCPLCGQDMYLSKSSSKPEKEIQKIIPYSVIGNKSFIYPYEIDIYSEKYKFGVEYDGLLWHSEGITFPIKENLKYIHIRKTKMCNEKGYQLFHIFENEWLNPIKKKIWISKIEDKLKQNTEVKSVNCTIREVQTKITRGFFNKNCLEGYSKSSINIGLYKDDELVQIMSFYKKYDNYTLKICNKVKFSILGNDLLRYFEKKYKPKKITIIANIRWSSSSSYIELGFKLNKITEPNFMFFKNTIELSKKTVCKNYNHELSEDQNIFNNRYRRIWDCGNYIFVKKYYEF